MWNLREKIDYLRHAKSGENIILTGVPRSGTTLVCKLLCELPNVVALNEPLDHQFFPTPEEAEVAIARHFQTFRRSLYFKGTALARTRDGKIVDNAFAEKNAEDRQRVISRSEVLFGKPLTADFTLLMKHCAEFSLILPKLKDKYKTFAVIRNPLAVLASWHSVNVPVSRGKIPKSARLHPEFYQRLNALPDDLITRQLFILSWYFEQYQQLPKQQIIRYEEVVSAPEETLELIVGNISDSDFNPLNSRNVNDLYRGIDFSELVDRLLHSEGAYWAFYERQAVNDLARQMQANYEK